MDTNLLNLFGAGFGGGLAVKLLDYVYQEYRHRSETHRTATDLVDKHIDPILKSADELVGKIRSLAQSDFSELIKAKTPKDFQFESWVPYLNILYLFAQFWSKVQILRIESLFVNIASDKRGKKLLDFLKALEATRTCLVERAWQRGIGEALINHGNDKIRSLSYIEFVHMFLSSTEFQKWFRPLVSVVSRINHTRERQRLLLYGAILHALIDTLDQDHLVTNERPTWANKITERTRKNLKFRVFPIYLPFVKNPKRYY